ncbi:MAG: FAD-dependent oxidoreductase [Clostridiales bacterium]|nr:FAD-dependent oxidoreductase [Clostridiales bacterium]MCF8021945.1 FAD-dependent oxidoreductase [Clostridiales bacterium]
MSNKKNVGAVLVVGGGIAGIQASLDLADLGYYVYLIEKSTAIGGEMARLDKTFPTNDCSMCILSPKLVGCGRHLNIENHTGTEIKSLKGIAGNYKVLLHKHARYIDTEKCTGCGECSNVCPVELPCQFNCGLDKRKAVYKLYAQAMPAAYAIEKNGFSPCRAACPAGVNVQGYVQLVKNGKYKEAWRLIYEDNPLPAICGRICTRPCESHCYRGKIDSPVSIRELKKFAADFCYKKPDELPLPQVPQNKSKKVAVIGSGPAGLSAAYQLIKSGYDITVFEAMSEPGGMLRVVIPEYRLPKNILDFEISLLQKIGVKIETNCRLGQDFTLNSLKKQGYEAIFLAIGAQKSVSLNLPGEKLQGVQSGIELLKKINTGKNPEIGQRVAVIGGGNTAMDAARTALRVGASEVTIVYRRSEDEITAEQEEIRQAKEEGVQFKMLTSPQKIMGNSGEVNGLKCVYNDLGEPDSSGRRRPIPIEGTDFELDLDSVIIAVGQNPELNGVEPYLEVSKKGTVKVNNSTMNTGAEGVFAAGDVVTGPANVIEAIGAGKKAAANIDCYLQNKINKNKINSNAEDNVVDFPNHESGNTGISRLEPEEIKAEKRINNFSEISLGFSEEDARKEAERCLNCAICSECGQCVEACMSKAINHDMQDEEIELNVGSIIISTGCETYDPTNLEYLGYNRHANVLTSIEFERVLSASGPYGGYIQRPSDGKEPKKIAWLQCVGSRNHRENQGYCSSVCCMYAIKEAVIAKEHCSYPLHTTIFYMDMRTYGKEFEQYYEKAKNELKVNFVRSRIYSISELPDKDNNLFIRYADEHGNICNEEFDLVILSVGLKPSSDTVDIARKMDLNLNKYNFIEPKQLTGVNTNKDGIYVAGTLSGPKDIPETVMQASAAAADSASLLANVRGTMVKEKAFPPEKDIAGDIIRIGVFVCHCGINIGGTVDVPEVVNYVKNINSVAYATDKLYTCSQDATDQIKEAIQEYNLNRVVVASCTPRTHEPLFQETIKEAGLNPNLFEMANIRDQCSWVHMNNPVEATKKAKDLVAMAVAKSKLLEPIQSSEVEINHNVLVIGGGIAGLNSALNLAEQGYKVNIVEKEKQLGGIAKRINYGIKGEDVQSYLSGLIKDIYNNSLVTVFTESEIKDASGFVGNYTTTLTTGEEISHGVTIIATGANEYKPSEYLYGQNNRVMTLLELEEAMASNDVKINNAENYVFIQCVGSRDDKRPYCSRICCTKSINTALKIKKSKPEANIYILYRDIRTYSFLEDKYREARQKGVIFIRYNNADKPVVENSGSTLKVTITDHVLDIPIVISADIIGLASAIVPPEENNNKLSQLYKVPLNQDNFFLEAHMKLRPVDSSADGVFMAGLAHGPKNLEENIAQAKAAAGRAGTILTQDTISIEGKCAVVDKQKCVGCRTCESVCPAHAVQLDEQQKVAVVNEALCKGCGVCASSCRCGAINIKGWTDEQIAAMVNAL